MYKDDKISSWIYNQEFQSLTKPEKDRPLKILGAKIPKGYPIFNSIP